MSHLQTVTLSAGVIQYKLGVALIPPQAGLKWNVVCNCNVFNYCIIYIYEKTTSTTSISIKKQDQLIDMLQHK